ncbi:MAG: hypothetical protein IMW86_04545 [Hydrogenibacillus sp.]|nr:hypothetical protein [Hydrogenibacillus sp.]
MSTTHETDPLREAALDALEALERPPLSSAEEPTDAVDGGGGEVEATAVADIAASRHRRYDSWREDEDRLLAELVIHYVKSGRTQIEAFAEAAGRLGRTASACGFRWNKALRHQFQKNLEEAKKERRELRKKRMAKNRERPPVRTLDSVQFGALWTLIHDLERTVGRLKEELYRLREKLEQINE